MSEKELRYKHVSYLGQNKCQSQCRMKRDDRDLKWRAGATGAWPEPLKDGSSAVEYGVWSCGNRTERRQRQASGFSLPETRSYTRSRFKAVERMRSGAPFCLHKSHFKVSMKQQEPLEYSEAWATVLPACQHKGKLKPNNTEKENWASLNILYVKGAVVGKFSALFHECYNNTGRWNFPFWRRKEKDCK